MYENNNSELKRKRDNALISNNAQTIYDNLNEIINLGGNEKRRWLWELMQNAKDSASEEKKINIKVEILDDIVNFFHDGMPFKDEEVIHLIYLGLTKKDLEDKTGKFGTGFLTTHLLSKKVSVKGLMNDNKEKMASISEFQRLLHQFFTSLPAELPPMSIENRNPFYLNSSYFRFLNDLNLSHVFLQGYFMPPIVGIYNKYKEYIKDQPIIRLHGPDRSGIEIILGEN